jgi:hypothetical protein
MFLLAKYAIFVVLSVESLVGPHLKYSLVELAAIESCLTLCDIDASITPVPLQAGQIPVPLHSRQSDIAKPIIEVGC